MNNSFIMLAIFIVFVALPGDQARAHAPLGGNTKLYHQCILDHMQGVKLNMVADEIKRICWDSYRDKFSVSKKEQLYNGCLLTYLRRVESEIAAKEIINSCRGRYLE